jgi:hypothetical protein
MSALTGDFVTGVPAVKRLKAARRAATASGRLDVFAEHLTALREQNRRRPTLMTMLDKAKL